MIRCVHNFLVLGGPFHLDNKTPPPTQPWGHTATWGLSLASSQAQMLQKLDRVPWYFLWQSDFCFGCCCCCCSFDFHALFIFLCDSITYKHQEGLFTGSDGESWFFKLPNHPTNSEATTGGTWISPKWIAKWIGEFDLTPIPGNLVGLNLRIA